MNSLSSATFFGGDLFFGGGGDLFLFLMISTKRELRKLTPKKISVYVKYQLFSWGGNITIEFMFAGIHMFWTRLRLILARAARRGLK